MQTSVKNLNIFIAGKIEEKGFGADFADDYLAVGDYNIFSIDWGDLESWANYPHVGHNFIICVKNRVVMIC